MAFFGASRPVQLLSASSLGAFAGITGFFVWTKHCDMRDLPATDPLWNSKYLKQFNPRGNPSMNDVCIRRIPLAHIRPDLLEDDKKGGGKLVEALCGGIFGGSGYTVQRLIHSRNKPPSSETSALIESLSQATESTTASSSPATQPNQSPTLSQSLTSQLSSLFSFSSPSPANPSTPPTLTTPSPSPSPPPTEIWSKPSLQHSSFPTSTIITNHFLVLSRQPPHTILLRCGDSPLTNPTTPRASDGLFELSATTDYTRGYAEFTLKSIFYDGTKELSDEETAKGEKPMGPTLEWLHRQYTKLWMESGVARCRMSKWRSLDKQREMIKREAREREEKEREEKERAQGQGAGRLLEEKK